MIWGKDEKPETPIKLGSSEISIVGSCKHMGVTLASDRKLEETSYTERIGAAKNTVNYLIIVRAKFEIIPTFQYS